MGAGTGREGAGTKRAGSGTVKARSGIQGGGVRWCMAGFGGWESPGILDQRVFTNPLFQIKQELSRMSDFILVCSEEGGETTEVRGEVSALPPLS